MRRGGGGQPEQEADSSPGAALLAGGCRRSGFLPGAWVSPARQLPPVPQWEHLLGDGYHGAGMGQSWSELQVPLRQAGEQRESSCCGEPLARRRTREGWGFPGAGQKGAVEERLPVVMRLCKGKRELHERKVNASPGAAISVVPGWGPSLLLPGARSYLCRRCSACARRAGACCRCSPLGYGVGGNLRFI